jgi:hypothetical protein
MPELSTAPLAPDGQDVGWTMRLSFIVAGSPDRPPLMLSDFAGHELGDLRETAGDLASGQRDEVTFRVTITLAAPRANVSPTPRGAAVSSVLAAESRTSR